jgi:hypothetical protein
MSNNSNMNKKINVLSEIRELNPKKLGTTQFLIYFKTDKRSNHTSEWYKSQVVATTQVLGTLQWTNYFFFNAENSES